MSRKLKLTAFLIKASDGSYQGEIQVYMIMLINGKGVSIPYASNESKVGPLFEKEWNYSRKFNAK